MEIINIRTKINGTEKIPEDQQSQKEERQYIYSRAHTHTQRIKGNYS